MTFNFQSGNAQEIWDVIFEGKKIQVSFVSIQAAKAFRIRLNQIKLQKQQMMKDIGFINEGEEQRIVMDRKDEGPDFPCTYTVYLEEKKDESKKYFFKILEE